MINESAIVTTFDITQHGQVKLFQFKIPREVKYIIGIEMGMKWLSGLPDKAKSEPREWTLPMVMQPNLQAGEFRLQSYEKANIFYTGELTADQNIGFADFTSRHFNPAVFSHRPHAHEEQIKVSGKTTLVQGVYRDKLNNQITQQYQYKVYLYVWTTLKDEPENSQP